MMRFALILILAFAALGCGPNEAILKSARNDVGPSPGATLAPRRTSFEQDLAEMKEAGFDYVFVIRRKDGKPFEDEDRRFLRESMPHEINRRVSSDDGKAFIFGSGFAVDPKSIDTWRSRYLVEEHFRSTEKVESAK
jgi:hypothetical protein